MKARKNLYIVDDIQENLQLLGSILKKGNFNISVARSGEQAIVGIKNKMPDLILLDVSMPGMDGFEVCEILKRDSLTAQIPVIFITARTQSEDVVRGFKVGGVDYVTKPFNSEELLSRVNTHLELKEARENLLELNATKDKFFRIIAHDLKSPFSSILGFTSLIVENIDDFSQDKIKEYLLMLNKMSQTTYELLKNLLEWARSQSGEITFLPEQVEVVEVINDNIVLLKESAQNKSIVLTSEIEDDIALFGDKNMIKTVIRNLISNAIKFTPENGKIVIKSNSTNEGTEFSVIDSGIGISQENISKLFRLDVHHTTVGTKDEKGTGLGLILCKEFVEKHNGKIWVESEVGIGTTFKFTIVNN